MYRAMMYCSHYTTTVPTGNHTRLLHASHSFTWDDSTHSRVDLHQVPPTNT
jgi:hypothetical protein